MGPDAYVVTIAAAGAPPPPVSLASAGLRCVYEREGLTVWTSAGPRTLSVIPIASRAVLIGEVYGSSGDAAGPASAYDVASLAGLGIEPMAERLLKEAWGRYILIDHDPASIGAFRDPGGALDCVTWRSAGRRIFSARLPRNLDPLLASAISIDWAVVARQLHDPLAISGASALRNLFAIEPGALWRETTAGLGEVKSLWRPAAQARRRHAMDVPSNALRERVQVSVATLAHPYRRRLAEISGGLDSAIVTAALNVASRQPGVVTRWINYAPVEAEGDERRYARAVAEANGLELTERARNPLQYNEADLAQVGADFRVGLTALDPDYDRDLEAQALAFDAEALITGQGGDAVFLQMATRDALADRLRVRGQVELAELLAHSRRWRLSVWRTLGETIRRAAWPSPYRIPSRAYLTPTDTFAPSHPWLEDLADLPPAKAAQVRSLVASQNVFGPSRRGDVVRCLHPLLSQPVVELVLSIPSFELTRGGEDRALARTAFAGGLQEIVRVRRTKGSMQAFYGRAVAASLPILRPWLLDGILQREGLVRADKLEPMLDPNLLIMTDVYIELLHVAAIEAWARGWSERIATIRRRPIAPAPQGCPLGS